MSEVYMTSACEADDHGTERECSSDRNQWHTADTRPHALDPCVPGVAQLVGLFMQRLFGGRDTVAQLTHRRFSAVCNAIDGVVCTLDRKRNTSQEPCMKFSAFIKDNLDALVADWEAFPTKLPAGRTMSTLALRDHSREILLAIAGDMERRQSDQDRADESQDIVPTEASTTSAAAEHGALRQMAGFDLVQLFAEFRALRASVLAKV